MDLPRLTLLGGFEFRASDGSVVALPGRKPMALLAYLALAPGMSHARAKLADLLWESYPEAQARGSLRQALSALRKALPTNCGDALDATAADVTLAHDCLRIDVAEFETLAVKGAAGGDRVALARAADLYRGDLLDGFGAGAPAFDDWAMVERQRQRERALGTFDALLGLEERAGNVEAAVRAALRILALDQLQESAHRALMRLYARQGRHAAALRQFAVCRDVLANELGVAPEP
ncbi:MAG TPA: BTAD domain-containing putative transcriptional regulator, partial [Arenibaculum sp.]|nr:BTAD domain-containing putative transcriptional regulator [Arenibaculum sp.]